MPAIRRSFAFENFFKKLGRAAAVGLVVAASSHAPAQLVEGKPLSPQVFESWVSQKAKPVKKWSDVDRGKPVVLFGEDHNAVVHFDFLAENAAGLKKSGITHVFFEYEASFQKILDDYLQTYSENKKTPSKEKEKMLEKLKFQLLEMREYGSRGKKAKIKLFEALHDAGIKIKLVDDQKYIAPIPTEQGVWFRDYGRNVLFSEEIDKLLDGKNRILMVVGNWHALNSFGMPWLLQHGDKKSLVQSILIAGGFDHPTWHYELSLQNALKSQKPHLVPLEKLETKTTVLHPNFNDILYLPSMQKSPYATAKSAADFTSELFLDPRKLDFKKLYSPPPK
ncbi:hypothetical protein J4220_00935 [Candidatus Micrarchaeota archaeon]|nr:hypothetical protein [Candidatus Micrarchaeota archaeon]